MADQTARGDDFEKQAEKKIAGRGIFGSKYEDATDLLDKAANCFKLAKNWERAASTYIKLASCHIKLESKHEAASAYVDAAKCYRKCSSQGGEVVISFDQGRNIIEHHRAQYPDMDHMVTSNLLDKTSLEKAATGHSFQLTEFVEKRAHAPK